MNCFLNKPLLFVRLILVRKAKNILVVAKSKKEHFYQLKHSALKQTLVHVLGILSQLFNTFSSLNISFLLQAIIQHRKKTFENIIELLFFRP